MIGLFGGTFNPIHLGHLRLAEIALTLGIAPIHFIPAHVPPHRATPELTFDDRVTLIQEAIQHNPDFLLDVYPYPSSFRVGVGACATGLYGSVHEDCELGEDNAPDNLRGTGIREQARTGPSYMVDTLASLRSSYGATEPLALLIGADTLQQLTTWHQWPKLFQYAHIIAFSRPGYSLKAPNDLISYQINDIIHCFNTSSGFLYTHLCDTLPISATDIRKSL